MTNQTDRIDGLVGSVAVKAPCRAATTANITLSGEQVIDGVSAVVDDRILVKNQTTGLENGIYNVSASSWARARDWNGLRDIVEGTIVKINYGTASARLTYAVTSSNPVVGTTAITFENNAIAAANVPVSDAGEYFVGETVEAVLQEVGAAIETDPVAADIGIADVDSNFNGTDVEAALQELASGSVTGLIGYQTSNLQNIVDGYALQRFNTGGVFALTQGFAISQDGKNVLVADNSYNVHWLKMGVAWDLQTMYDTGISKDLSGQFTWINELFYNDDGTKMFVNYSTLGIHEYTLSTPYDPSSSTYVDNFAPTPDIDDFHFNSDGTHLVFTDNTDDTIYHYTLSPGFDISTATLSESVDLSADLTGCDTLTMSEDGYTLIAQGNDYTHEFTLGTAWDVSTATHTAFQDISGAAASNSTTIHLTISGSYLFCNNNSVDVIIRVQLNTPGLIASNGWAYPLDTTLLDDSTGEYIGDLCWAADGLSFYVLDYDNSYVYQFNCTTAWDTSTASEYDDLYIGGTAAYPCWAMWVTHDEKHLYVISQSDDTIYQFDFGTPGDLTTCSYASKSKSITAVETSPTSLYMTEDGLDIYFCGIGADAVQKWSLTTAYDISTAATASQTTGSLSATHPAMSCIHFHPSGRLLWIGDSTNKDLYEYRMTTAWDVSTIGDATLIYDNDKSPQIRYFRFKPDGTKLFINGTGNQHVATIPLAVSIMGL